MLAEIQQFLSRHNMSWTRFGRLAVHDPRFVEDSRNGREPRERTAEKVRMFISTYGI